MNEILPEDHVKQARRHTGYLCHEGILISRIEVLKTEREKLIGLLACLMNGLDEYWVCTPEGDRAVLEARAVLAEAKGE
jgi:hypothetical protein